MEEQNQVWIQPIPSPWRDVLLQAISQVQRELFFICPFLKEQVITDLKTTLQTRVSSAPLRVRVLTRVLPDDLLAGASDLSALQQLLRWPQELPGSSVELRAIDKVHAKVWLIDNVQVIIGSGNATPSGLDRNLEYGVVITNAEIVTRVWQDWEPWWNRAGVVNEQLLEQMQNWLIGSRQQLQKLETARQEILRTIEPAPRIGQHLSPRTRQSTPATPAILAPTESASSRVAEDRQAYTADEPITASPDHLRSAFQWVYPFSLDGKASRVALPTHEFIKLTWNKNAQQFTLTWANGQRRSEASIPAHGGNTGTSWAITLDLDSAQSIVSYLIKWENVARRMGGSSREDLQLSLHHWVMQDRVLHIQRGSLAYTGIPVTLTNPPSAFPHLQAPISRLAGIEHQALSEMLAQQPSSATTIWLRLSRAGSTVSLVFSASSSDNLAQVISLPAAHSQLVGPPIAFQLVTADLQQVLREAPTVVSRWSIEIDRDARAMQFVPETDNEVVGRWRHHLWHVGE